MNTNDNQHETEPQRSGLDVMRGIAASLLFGTIGLLAPIIVVGSCTVCRWVVEGANGVERAKDIQRLEETLILPVIGAALVFAAAGWATCAPNGSYRFVGTLVLVFAVSALSWILLIFALDAFRMWPRSYNCLHPPVYLIEVLVLGIPPIVTAAVLSLKRRKAPGAPAAEETNDSTTRQ